MKEKHIERLSKGKKSGVNVGSRHVPHRLKLHEQRQFSIAIRRGYLRVKFDSRVNLENLWQKYCQAREWPHVVLKQRQNGEVELWQNGERFDFGVLHAAIERAEALVKGLV